MNYRHGFRYTRFYRIWKNIKARGSGHHSYCKGISYCKKWETFLGFKKDMYDSYLIHCKKHGENNTSIDRINCFKGYYIKNCRWATIKEQARNKKNNIFIKYKNKNMILQDWAEEKNMDPETLRNRLNRGWSIKRSIETPSNLYHEGKKLPKFI